MELLSVEGVRKSFGALVAVRDVSLKIDEGEILGLIGPNGSGKSTLLNTIAGAYKPEKGKIFFEKKRIDGKRPDQICRMGIARTYQAVKPFLTQTVTENILLSALHSNDETKTDDKLSSSISTVGLNSMEGIHVSKLPLIHRRRVEIARGMASGCKLLLLDEPMAGLNLTEISEFSGIIRRINSQGTSMLIIEHVMRAIMQLSSRIVVLDHGEKIAEGTPAEIAADAKVARVYMGTENQC